MVASHTSLIGDLVHNPGMCPDWDLNLGPFGSQAVTQSTETYQPGQPQYLVYEVERQKHLLQHASEEKNGITYEKTSAKMAIGDALLFPTTPPFSPKNGDLGLVSFGSEKQAASH